MKSFVFVTSIAVVTYAVFYFFPSTSTILPTKLSYSLFGERCTGEWLVKNVTQLKEALEANVFGQHVATKLLCAKLTHLNFYSAHYFVNF
jgi:hypothetical protein